ncbi:hypothetical protein NFI96_010396 [Prochilodus magdalenae]|nr:hypothetical protein NFI96_010396 [Prochilodus magdalenae]
MRNLQKCQAESPGRRKELREEKRGEPTEWSMKLIGLGELTLFTHAVLLEADADWWDPRGTVWSLQSASAALCARCTHPLS